MSSAVERFETASAVLAGLLTGATVGVVGSTFHRYRLGDAPVGVVVALVAVALGVVFMRALAGRGALAAYAVALLGVILGIALVGSDRILLLGQGIGLVWAIGAAVLALAGFVLPERWFSEA
jgi:hypothetical protein